MNSTDMTMPKTSSDNFKAAFVIYTHMVSYNRYVELTEEMTKVHDYIGDNDMPVHKAYSHYYMANALSMQPQMVLASSMPVPSNGFHLAIYRFDNESDRNLICTVFSDYVKALNEDTAFEMENMDKIFKDSFHGSKAFDPGKIEFDYNYDRMYTDMYSKVFEGMFIPPSKIIRGTDGA